jgi:hypothetical protein
MPYDPAETRDDRLSLPMAAARLRRSWPQAYRLALQGQLGPMQKVGRTWALSATAVEEFLERNTEVRMDQQGPLSSRTRHRTSQ